MTTGPSHPNGRAEMLGGGSGGQASILSAHDKIGVEDGDTEMTSESDNAATEFSDSDSALGGSYASSTYTMSSSLMAEIVEENGRTYHVYKDGKYMLPNDEIELNRLDMQNKMWSITLSGHLHLAPIDPNPHNVLDIGTGTGIWAIDFGTLPPPFLIPP
ncbi:Secondary metabolism regulator [Lachnellula suecica]|uniref:Secondary metabolism regulator n=1 Tax=Lachnellula suecica TaxID=602035 RepID=A0A8T9BPY5_9HELO|nr:Secondary metabolism regulator [Lachnellula suecica]